MSTFWSFKAAAEPDAVELRIDGDIVDDGDAWIYEWFGEPCTSPNGFRQELNKYSGRRINVWINSYGGSVFAGTGIYNALKNHNGKVTVIIDGIAASIASVIAMAGDVVEIAPVGMLMIHNPMGCMGYAEAKEFRHMADMLDKVRETILNAYALKTNIDRAELTQLMDDETYMTAGDAVRLGFADGVHNVATEQRDLVNCVFSRGKAIGVEQARMEDALQSIAASLRARRTVDTAVANIDKCRADILDDARQRLALRARIVSISKH
ncbi:MAG: Clp protease ClpP [Clostridia bacterium]